MGTEERATKGAEVRAVYKTKVVQFLDRSVPIATLQKDDGLCPLIAIGNFSIPLTVRRIFRVLEVEAVYKTKVVQFFGRSVPIATLQDDDGLCPLIAIGDVLLLRSNLIMSLDTSEMPMRKLLSLVAERPIDSNINVEDTDTLNAIGSKSYNALIEELVYLEMKNEEIDKCVHAGPKDTTLSFDHLKPTDNDDVTQENGAVTSIVANLELSLVFGLCLTRHMLKILEVVDGLFYKYKIYEKFATISNMPGIFWNKGMTEDPHHEVLPVVLIPTTTPNNLTTRHVFFVFVDWFDSYDELRDYFPDMMMEACERVFQGSLQLFKEVGYPVLQLLGTMPWPEFCLKARKVYVYETTGSDESTSSGTGSQEFTWPGIRGLRSARIPRADLG